MDIIDDAAVVTQEFISAAIARARRVVVGGVGSSTCEECGDEIGQARRVAAPWATRCVECQEMAERARGRGRLVRA
jgi:phage/conjugal plasmid C-4 type zinc finger TraR family protein